MATAHRSWGGVDSLLPHNIYAWSKWLFDKYTEAKRAGQKNKVIGFRFFNVFGWGEFHKGKNANIVYRFYEMLKEQDYIDLFREPIERDHVYVKDVCEVLFQSMTSDRLGNGIYNLGGNHPVTHRRVAEIVAETMMEEGVIDKKDLSAYIRLIDMPKDLKSKFQFHTFAEGQEAFISTITQNNEEKMKEYVIELIRKKK